MKAREVYKDCLYAKECLRRAVDERRLRDAKLFWFATMTLLRTIAYVLKGVDRPARADHSPFANEFDKRWKQWKNKPIFWDFMKEERDRLVHEYASNLAEREKLEDGFLLSENGDYLLTEDSDPIGITTTITRLVISGGKFDGSEPDILVSRALEWLDKELTELEKIP